jgi:hypothetical protein
MNFSWRISDIASCIGYLICCCVSNSIICWHLCSLTAMLLVSLLCWCVHSCIAVFVPLMFIPVLTPLLMLHSTVGIFTTALMCSLLCWLVHFCVDVLLLCYLLFWLLCWLSQWLLRVGNYSIRRGLNDSVTGKCGNSTWKGRKCSDLTKVWLKGKTQIFFKKSFILLSDSFSFLKLFRLFQTVHWSLVDRSGGVGGTAALQDKKNNFE